MVNDYKTDAGKVPLLDALQPFMPALYALARMMDDMQHKHRLAGAANPFMEWAQLPAAQQRMSRALVRHILPEEAGVTLWSVNTKDGTHLHATHGLFNLLGALSLHLRALEAQAKLFPAKQDLANVADYRPVLERARVELALQGEHMADHPPGQYWTGETCTWFCTCGAGRAEACTCTRASGMHI